MNRRSVADKRHRRALTRTQAARFHIAERWQGFRVRATLALDKARKIRGLSSLLSIVSANTALGWGVGLVGTLALIFGLANSWTELVAIGIMSLTVLIIALVWSIGRAGYQVSLNLSTYRVTVGERALGELVVVNPTGRNLPATAIELPVGAGSASFVTGRLAAGEEHTEPFGIATSRRGVVTVGPATAVRGDSLGLVKRTQTWSDSTDLYIHPRTIRVSASAIGFIRDIEGITTHDLSSSDVSFHALRDYAAGDDRRNIHWKTTARVGKLMVRQFEETRRAHLLIVLDLDDEAWASEDEFEDGVSGAASLAMATMKESKEVSIITQGGALKTPTGLRALDSLAAVELLSGAERLPELARKASAEVPQASVAIVVTGSRMSIASIHAALSRLPLNTTSFGARFDASSGVETRTIGGFTVVTVPSLDDFGLGMQRILG